MSVNLMPISVSNYVASFVNPEPSVSGIITGCIHPKRYLPVSPIVF